MLIIQIIGLIITGYGMFRIVKPMYEMGIGGLIHLEDYAIILFGMITFMLGGYL